MDVRVDDLGCLTIGREVDGGVKCIRIDCYPWRKRYPQLTEYRIEVTTPKGYMYMPETSMDGDVLIWPITAGDTAVSGRGRYQIVATGAPGERKTSAQALLVVLPIMPGTAEEEPPDPAKPWTDKVAADADRAEEAAQAAQQAKQDVDETAEAATQEIEKAAEAATQEIEKAAEAATQEIEKAEEAATQEIEKAAEEIPETVRKEIAEQLDSMATDDTLTYEDGVLGVNSETVVERTAGLTIADGMLCAVFDDGKE